MIGIIFKNIIRFVFLIFFQVLVLNNIELFHRINPYMYILFIILIPLQTPRWILILFSAFSGLCVDIFMNTYGMNMAASCFIGYIRPFIINLMLPKGEVVPEGELNLKYLGINRFVMYALTMTFLHHLVLFYAEVFRLNEFFETFAHVLLNSLFTLILIVISQFIFTPKTQGKIE